MKLIIDSGATKADWCAVQDGSIVRNVKTKGLNLAVMERHVLEGLAEEAVAGLGNRKMEEIHFYAAGIIISASGELTPEQKSLKNILEQSFECSRVELASDMLGAARAVCGNKPGIAAILGTGSNSCMYDGTNISSRKVAAGGYILGDEGSGARLGKLFISDYIKELIPADVAEPFGKAFKVDYPTVVREVYHGDSPSGYLGSFAPWILEHYNASAYVRNLVDGNFLDFINRCLKQYDKVPVGVIGGFGNACKDILARLGKEQGIEFSRFVASPMDGLLDFHR